MQKSIRLWDDRSIDTLYDIEDCRISLLISGHFGLNAQPKIQIFNGLYLRYLDLLKQIDVIIILVGSGVLVLYWPHQVLLLMTVFKNSLDQK